MSDAFNDAIRDRQNADRARAAGGEPSVSVFVVKIGNKNLGSEAVIGALYWTEEEAMAEVKRLNAANSFTRASWVERHLPVWRP